MKLFQVTLSRGYGEEQFKEDLKELYKELGTGPVVFLFTDAHVVEEGFLEFINNMLTTGMVPALYAQDEKDSLANSVRAECKAAGIAETPDNLWSFYVNKCRNNLHIVLAMSPSGSKLRIRCRNYFLVWSPIVLSIGFSHGQEMHWRRWRNSSCGRKIYLRNTAAILSNISYFHIRM